MEIRWFITLHVTKTDRAAASTFTSKTPSHQSGGWNYIWKYIFMIYFLFLNDQLKHFYKLKKIKGQIIIDISLTWRPISGPQSGSLEPLVQRDYFAGLHCKTSLKFLRKIQDRNGLQIINWKFIFLSMTDLQTCWSVKITQSNQRMPETQSLPRKTRDVTCWTSK